MHREMKKLLLSLALLLCVGSSFGQTAEKLMEKYKAFPSAEYKEKTEEALKDIKEEGPGDMSQKTLTLSSRTSRSQSKCN